MILGFKNEFIPLIVAGTKIHSIRKGNRWRVGQVIDFFANVRRPDMYRFRPNAFVVAVQAISLTEFGVIKVDGRALSGAEKELLAANDGFASLAAMMKFFATHGDRMPPLKAQLIHWTPLTY